MKNLRPEKSFRHHEYRRVRRQPLDLFLFSVGLPTENRNKSSGSASTRRAGATARRS
jgi:hypothetical protein